jgi:hypothetical protein
MTAERRQPACTTLAAGRASGACARAPVNEHRALIALRSRITAGLDG